MERYFKTHNRTTMLERTARQNTLPHFEKAHPHRKWPLIVICQWFFSGLIEYFHILLLSRYTNYFRDWFKILENSRDINVHWTWFFFLYSYESTACICMTLQHLTPCRFRWSFMYTQLASPIKVCSLPIKWCTWATHLFILLFSLFADNTPPPPSILTDTRIQHACVYVCKMYSHSIIKRL